MVLELRPAPKRPSTDGTAASSNVVVADGVEFEMCAPRRKRPRPSDAPRVSFDLPDINDADDEDSATRVAASVHDGNSSDIDVYARGDVRQEGSDSEGSPLEEGFGSDSTLVASDDWDSEATLYTDSESEDAASPLTNNEVIHPALRASPG